MTPTRLYLDTAPLIYLIEQVAPFYSAVEARLTSAAGSEAEKGLILVVSELSRLECRVKPLRLGDEDLLRDYDEYFAAIDQIVPLSRAVVDEATKIRATYGFKTPDSLHLAAAVVSGCNVFYTNDQRLNRFTDVTIEVV